MLKIDLTGHRALVTGATGELGRSIARTLAGCGADVVVHYHTNERTAAGLREEIERLGRKAFAVQADVSDRESVLRMREQIQRGMEGACPDIVITNAVIQYDWKRVLEQPLEDFAGQYRSCVAQNVLMAQVFCPPMIDKGWGRIIAINTECAMQCQSGQGAYVSGKRGMDGVLRVLAKEVGPHGITVNQIAPGWMITDKFREAGTERQEFYEKNVPLRRRGEDLDIARAAAFLASDLAGFITGVYLPVCGGNVMPSI